MECAGPNAARAAEPCPVDKLSIFHSSPFILHSSLPFCPNAPRFHREAFWAWSSKRSKPFHRRELRRNVKRDKTACAPRRRGTNENDPLQTLGICKNASPHVPRAGQLRSRNGLAESVKRSGPRVQTVRYLVSVLGASQCSTAVPNDMVSSLQRNASLARTARQESGFRRAQKNRKCPPRRGRLTNRQIALACAAGVQCLRHGLI